MNFVFAVLWILAMASPLGTMFSFDGAQPAFGFLITGFFIAVSVGYWLVSKFLGGVQGRAVIVVILLLGGNITAGELYRPFKDSIFAMIVSGLALGILLSLRLAFHAASETVNAPTLAGYPVTMMWAAFLGYLSGFAISINFTVQIPMDLIIVVLLAGITVIVVLGERARFIRLAKALTMSNRAGDNHPDRSNESI
jgi:hypothetical protein